MYVYHLFKIKAGKLLFHSRPCKFYYKMGHNHLSAAKILIE